MIFKARVNPPLALFVVCKFLIELSLNYMHRVDNVANKDLHGKSKIYLGKEIASSGDRSQDLL